MEEDEEISVQNKFLNFAKSNILLLVFFVGGVGFLGIGFVQILGKHESDVKFEKGGEVTGVSSTSDLGSDTAKIKVDVEGQVERPGVYSLSSDARVQDAILEAGGVTNEADREQINLAAKIADGQKIYVPSIGEQAVVVTSGNGAGILGGDASESINPGGPVSINSAPQAQLEELPSIGPVTAQKIISNRPYGMIEELLSKKALGQATFEKVKDLVSL